MKKLNSLLNKKKETFYTIIIFIFSISINQYYGNLGVCPIDSFWFFNSGYDTLKGYYPFKDYWTIAGPFITFTQALFFKILGVSWFSYVFHASVFNFLISISTFFILLKFKLRSDYCLIYALLISILAYPSAGTPYVDHHASILSIISLFIFILALKTNLKIYWFFLPIVLAVSFLTKQTPTGNIFLLIVLLSAIYFIFNFDIKKILFGILGSFTILAIFFLILFITEISFGSFYEQYILFPLSIGKTRVEYFLFPLEFSRIILRFKLIHIPLFVLIFIALQNTRYNFKYLKSNDFLIIISLVVSSYIFIAHQLMTINGMFIFFIIPILGGFLHIYFLEKYKNKNFILYFFIILTVCSSLHYSYKYIHKRDFMDLREVNFNKAIDANLINNKLKGLKWISCLNPESPKIEISNLIESINLINMDTRTKGIITEYQFISVILNKYDYSPSQVWFINHVVNEDKKSRFFKSYKNLLINKIKKNNIEVFYLIKPFWSDDKIFEKGLSKHCYKKTKINEILDVYLLQQCDDQKG